MPDRSGRLAGAPRSRVRFLFRLGRPSLQGSSRDAGVDLGHSRGLGELRPEGGGDRRPGGERSRRGAHSGARRGQRRAGIPRARGRLDIRTRQGGARTVIHIQSRSPRDRAAAEVDEPARFGRIRMGARVPRESCCAIVPPPGGTGVRPPRAALMGARARPGCRRLGTLEGRAGNGRPRPDHAGLAPGQPRPRQFPQGN
jgi:hypothetical protein